MGRMIPSLKAHDVKMLFKCVVTTVLVASLFAPGLLLGQQADSLMTKDYFVQQAGDEALLIRIDAFEAEFKSKVSEQGGNEILMTAMPGSRIAPLFQYISPQQDPRQLDIQVSSNQHTKRSEFSLALTRVEIWDDRSNSLDQTYQLLSFGLQASADKNAANWTVKIDSLINAGRQFKQFGMKEMRLWSNYMAAHLIQSHLHDHSIVYSMCREILAEVEGTRLQRIKLATLRLQSDALIGLKRSGAIKASANNPDPVQAALATTAKLAESMGFYYELAQTFNVSGTEYVADSNYAQALVQYQRAVEIADLVGDPEFATGIRESIVDIHALQGNVSASSAVLQEIESQLLDEGGDELALNLLAQGRLFIRSYQFLKAYEALSKAIIQQNNSAIRQQINFELARVFYETGRLDRSKTYLQLAQVKMDSDITKRGAVIDNSEGLRMLANIYRSQGDYKQMQKARSAQARHLPNSALYHYEHGLDVLASNSGNKSNARRFFNQSLKATTSEGYEDLRQLVSLQLCALDDNQNSPDNCSLSNARSHYSWLASAGIPRYSVEAKYLWAKTLILNGRRSEALQILDDAVTDIHFYRHAVAGVLGAWYRQRSEILFDYYLRLVLGNRSPAESINGEASLLILSKIRFAARYSESDVDMAGQRDNSELLRIQLGERLGSKSGQVIAGLSKSINLRFAELRQPFSNEFDFLSKSGLQSYFKGLKRDEVLLTYHVSKNSAHAWVGNNSGVQQLALANPDQLGKETGRASQNLAAMLEPAFSNTMNVLGSKLISPLSHLLKETVYFVPAGAFMGLPLDALRNNGQYLIEKHNVINLTAFPSKAKAMKKLEAVSLEKVFLAGHPQDYSSNYLSSLDTSSEISAVADVFVGPGLTIVQGTALLPDEFESEELKSADLVHLSMPGVINLKYPEQSNLELSSEEDEVERTLITPSAIRQQKISAELVFLSATGMREASDSKFSNRPAIIADFQSVGAKAVFVDLWASKGKSKDALISMFYLELAKSGKIAESSRTTKLMALKSANRDGSNAWAGLQLFIE